MSEIETGERTQTMTDTPVPHTNAPPALRRAGPYPMGLMVLLATVTMLFAAFTAAILMRRTGTDWVQVTLPQIIWANTLVILLSSVALEGARKSVRRGRDGRISGRWLGVAGLMGIVFLAGQILAWRMLVAQGVFLPSSPHAAFFYMLSGVHGAHVLGGIGALIWTFRRTVAGAYSAANYTGLTHAAIYWHFVGAVWLYLLIILLTL